MKDSAPGPHVILRSAENFHCEWLTADLVTWSTDRTDAYEFASADPANALVLAYNEKLPHGAMLGRANACPIAPPIATAIPPRPLSRSHAPTPHAAATFQPKRSTDARLRWWDN